MFWFFLHLTGALCWIFWATGLVPAEQWLSSAAFILLAVNSILEAMKALVGAN